MVVSSGLTCTLILTNFSSGLEVVLVQLEVLSAADEDLVGQEERGGVHDRWNGDLADQIQTEKRK
jgi:hypothetical protein